MAQFLGECSPSLVFKQNNSITITITYHVPTRTTLHITMVSVSISNFFASTIALLTLLILHSASLAHAQTITGINIRGRTNTQETTLMQGGFPQYYQAARTGGNTTVFITGENFPVDGSTVSAWYGREYIVPFPTGNVTAGSTGYHAICTITSDTMITCIAPCVDIGQDWADSGGHSIGGGSCRVPGVGSNHEWRLTITPPGGGAMKTISSLPVTTSFYPAFFATSNAFRASTSDSNMNDWSTTGGSTYNVEFYGTDNRGLKSDVNNVVYALYERADDTAVMGVPGKPLFASCEIEDSSAKTVLCTPAAGVGSGHRWTLYVGGVPAVEGVGRAKAVQFETPVGYRSPPTAYSPPSISAISIVGKSTFSTLGGDAVVLTGTNFGPLDVQNVVSATYRNNALGDFALGPFTARDCAVTVAHTEITCSSAPGVGHDHRWQVEVGGQASQQSSFITSYTAPAINVILPNNEQNNLTGLSTGGYGHSTCTDGFDSYSPCLIRLTGSDFGPVLASNTISATYGNGVYTATNCLVTVADTVIECQSVEKEPSSSSSGHSWIVNVGSQNSEASVATTQYAAPQILNMTTDYGGGLHRISTNGEDYIKFTGTNFGVMGSVITATYTNSDLEDAAGETYEAYCVNSDWGRGITTAHVSLTCKTNAGVGHHQRWTLTRDGDQIGGKSPADQYTSYVPPSIAYIGLGNEGCGKNCVTGGGEQILIVGNHLGGNPHSGNVNAVTYVEYTSVGTNGQLHTYGPFVCEKPIPSRALCTTVPGIGRNWQWRFKVGDQWSPIFRKNGDTADSELEYHNGYAGPTITNISLSSSSSASATTPPELDYSGNQSISIEGTNFGPIGTLTNPNMVTASCSSSDGTGAVFYLNATGCVVTVADTTVSCCNFFFF